VLQPRPKVTCAPQPAHGATRSSTASPAVAAPAAAAAAAASSPPLFRLNLLAGGPHPAVVTSRPAPLEGDVAASAGTTQPTAHHAKSTRVRRGRGIVLTSIAAPDAVEWCRGPRAVKKIPGKPPVARRGSSASPPQVDCWSCRSNTWLTPGLGTGPAGARGMRGGASFGGLQGQLVAHQPRTPLIRYDTNDTADTGIHIQNLDHKP
jgi:hypothetical protein